MELRDKLNNDPDSLKQVLPINISHFTILGEEIPLISAKIENNTKENLLL